MRVLLEEGTPDMSFHVGQEIGQYRIVSILGAGSMGRVFQVEHQVTKRQEAVKVLHADAVTDSQFLRFMREIEVQSRLDHPNIAKVRNALHFQSSLILVLELVEGQSLEKLLHKGKLPVRSAIHYLCQTLAGLEYAHDAGVVHRDVNPANLIITPDGCVKLTDFGLAKSLGDHQLTNDGDIVGSLHYMPPEQVRRQTEPDPRSDIYSAGAVLYELLTGKKLFECRDRLSLMIAQVQKQPVPPIEIAPEIGPELNGIVLKALAKDPDQRFQSAEGFRLALQRAINRSSGFKPGIASKFRVATLALAVCATAATGGFERIPPQTPVPPTVQPATIVQPIQPAVAVPMLRSRKKVTAHTARAAVTAPIEEPRILVQPPIVESPETVQQPETVTETIVEPEQEQIEPPPAEVQQQQQPSKPHKKGFWSRFNPFKKRKSEQTH
jgi:eukaryotic-like serine/threonine-protein kinase